MTILMINNPPKLTPRLQAVAELVPQGAKLADIGTDHAYLPVYLLKTGRISYAIASDVREGPVARAKDTIARYGMESGIETRLGSGLTSLRAGEADTVVIAGMGGLLIAGLLEESKELVKTIPLLLLQPMTAMAELREYLSQNGFRVARELLVREEEKIYHIFAVEHGEERVTDRAELYLGRRLLEERPPLFWDYLAQREHALSTAAEGMKKSSDPEIRKKLEEYLALLTAIKKIKEGEANASK